MILYQFPTSPFARRVRPALAFKGLDAELRDARANPEHAAETRRLNPMATVPVLVDGDRVVVDPAAILEYLDYKSPQPPLWPEGLARAQAVELSALTGRIVTTLADVGMRYHALHGHPQFDAFRVEAVGRAQRTLDAVGARLAGRVYACGGRWSAADIAVYTTVAWLEGLPKRAARGAAGGPSMPDGRNEKRVLVRGACSCVAVQPLRSSSWPRRARSSLARRAARATTRRRPGAGSRAAAPTRRRSGSRR